MTATIVQFGWAGSISNSLHVVLPAAPTPGNRLVAFMPTYHRGDMSLPIWNNGLPWTQGPDITAYDPTQYGGPGNPVRLTVFWRTVTTDTAVIDAHGNPQSCALHVYEVAGTSGEPATWSQSNTMFAGTAYPIGPLAGSGFLIGGWSQQRTSYAGVDSVNPGAGATELWDQSYINDGNAGGGGAPGFWLARGSATFTGTPVANPNLDKWARAAVGVLFGEAPPPLNPGAGIQTLMLEGPVTPTLVVQTRTYYADRAALMQLTPGKSRRGAGAGDVLPVGVYNGYHYRSAVRFPAIDWTGVKRVRAAHIRLFRTDGRLVEFGHYPTIYIRRITRNWTEGTAVSPSTHNAVRYPGPPTSQTGQVKANIANVHNKVKTIGCSAIVRAWAPVTAGGRGTPNYGFMLLPGSGREVDTIEFWSEDRSSGLRPQLVLQLEVLV